MRRIPAIAVLVGLAIAFDAGLSTVTSYVPQLVLLVVVAVGLAGGASYGAATGFCSGLVLDLAPTSAAVVGTGALAFTLVGWLAGVVAASLPEDKASSVVRFVRPMLVAGAGSLVVGLTFACCAVLFDEDRLGWYGVADLLRTVLPATIAVAPLLVPGTAALLRRWA